MQKGYKISFIIYSGILIFSILFMLMLLGANGHRIKLNYEHYLIGVFPLISISLLYIFPRTSPDNRNQKLIVGISSLAFMLISLYYAFENVLSILTENLIIEFKIISTLFTVVFIATIIYLIKQIFVEIKPNRTE
jgi:hypothetical protein